MDDDSSGMDEDDKPQVQVKIEDKEEVVADKPKVLVQPEEADAETHKELLDQSQCPIIHEPSVHPRRLC